LFKFRQIAGFGQYCNAVAKDLKQEKQGLALLSIIEIFPG
jgi:hypothetical protein